MSVKREKIFFKFIYDDSKGNTHHPYGCAPLSDGFLLLQMPFIKTKNKMKQQCQMLHKQYDYRYIPMLRLILPKDSDKYREL